MRKKGTDISIPDYVKSWFKNNNASYNWQSEGASIDGCSISQQRILDKIIIESQKDTTPLSAQAIAPSVREWIIKAKQEKLKFIQEEFSNIDRNGIDELEKWLRLVVGDIRDNDDLNVMVHFIWQVRRNLFSLEVQYHMMPVFVGKGAAGKSEAINYLLKPLEDIYIKSTFETFSDPRKHKSFEKYYVIFLDEMDYVSKTRTETIKAMMSSGKHLYQAKYSNDLESIRKNTTFIGASNKDLENLIYDFNMRRFWQIDALPPHKLRENWYKIRNDVDYELIWRCVDQAEDSPIVNRMPKIMEKQERFCKKDPVKEFSELALVKGPEHRTDKDTLYGWFGDWNKKQGIYKYLSERKFLNEIGKYVQKTKSGTMWYHCKKIDPAEELREIIKINNNKKRNNDNDLRDKRILN